MRRVIKFLPVFLLFIGACGSDHTPQPLPDEILIKVMADLHIAEAALQRLPRNYKDTVSQRYYDEVAKIHGLTRTQLDTALYWLRARPEEMFRVYEAVTEYLEKQETEVKGLYDPM